MAGVVERLSRSRGLGVFGWCGGAPGFEVGEFSAVGGTEEFFAQLHHPENLAHLDLLGVVDQLVLEKVVRGLEEVLAEFLEHGGKGRVAGVRWACGDRCAGLGLEALGYEFGAIFPDALSPRVPGRPIPESTLGGLQDLSGLLEGAVGAQFEVADKGFVCTRRLAAERGNRFKGIGCAVHIRSVLV
jgi:hypothetical protein